MGIDTNNYVRHHASRREISSPPQALTIDRLTCWCPSNRSVFHAAVAALMLPYFFLLFSMLARQVPTQTHAPSVRSHKMQS